MRLLIGPRNDIQTKQFHHYICIIAMLGYFVFPIYSWAGSPKSHVISSDKMSKEHFDAKKEFDELLAKAENGDIRAQYAVSFNYLQGKGIPQDYAKAAIWLAKAAEKGLPQAQTQMGVFYKSGWGVPKDYAEAANWFEKGAKQGNARAQWLLGKLYLEGQGVEKNPKKAVELFRKGAEQGYFPAQQDLATAYYEGAGVSKDYKKAVKWMLVSINNKIQQRPTFYRLSEWLNQTRNDKGGSPILDHLITLADKSNTREKELLANVYRSNFYFFVDNKQKEKALEYGAKAADQGITDSEFNHEYGYLLLKMNKPSEAVSYLTKATKVDLNKDNPLTPLFKKKFFPNMRSTKRATYWEHLGEAYVKLGEKDKAIEAYKESLRLNPDNKSAQEKLERLEK